MGKLDGKVALVTGSGRNIGRATVLKLAREGANVVVNARSNEQEANSVAREVRDLGVKAVPILADGTAPEAGSACDFPQNRQKRASASIGLPHSRQEPGPLLSPEAAADNAAPL